jgi:putative ABC transport system substrate-binding protein
MVGGEISETFSTFATVLVLPHARSRVRRLSCHATVEEDLMKAKIIVPVVVTLIVLFIPPIEAQQRARIPRVAYIAVGPLSALLPHTEAFRQGLRDLGYVEGKNITVELRSTDGKLDRVRGIADELVQQKVDVIVTAGGGVTGPVKAATATIPIVMAQDSDPVGNGFIVSLARPGGNITGLSNQSSELVGKRLEILKETIPKLSRIAVFGTSSNRDNARELKEIETTVAAFKLRTQVFDVLSAKDIDLAFKSAAKARADAILMIWSGPIVLPNRQEIADLAVKHRLPAMHTQRLYVEAGGLMYYGVNLLDLYRRAVTYVDKILKGRKAAELPVEQPTKFEFVVNLRAAEQIGLTIPPNVLARADKVIQ